MKFFPIAFAIVLAACGSKEAPPAATVPSDGVKVLGAGAEPRQLLRYHVAKGTTSELELALDVDIDAGGQGGPLPTLVLTSELVAEDVLPDGAIRMRSTITDVTARDRAGSALTAAQMVDQTQRMRGVIVRGTLAPTGTIRDAKVDTGGDVLPPTLAAQIQTLSRSFEQAAMPLPTTPVGVGATWMHSKTFAEGGMELTTTTTFTLTAITGDTLTFSNATLVSGKDQTVIQSGTKIGVAGIRGKGSGSGTIDLARMTFHGELLGELGSDMTIDGDTSRLSMKTATRAAPAPAKAAPVPPTEAPIPPTEAPVSPTVVPVPPPPGSGASTP